MAQSNTSSNREQAAAKAIMRLLQCMKEPGLMVVVQRSDLELLFACWNDRVERRSGLHRSEVL